MLYEKILKLLWKLERMLIRSIAPVYRYYPFPERQFLDPSKLKEFADDNFEFDENDRKFFKRVENTGYKQFLLFPCCFQKACIVNTQKPGLVWESFTSLLRLYHTFPSFNYPFENILKKCW